MVMAGDGETILIITSIIIHGVVERRLSQSDFQRHPRQKYSGVQRFFDGFQR